MKKKGEEREHHKCNLKLTDVETERKMHAQSNTS